MDQERRRFHLLLVFLALWNHAIGYPSLNSQVNPRSFRNHKAFSPWGFNSLSGASMTRNIPLGVHSIVLSVKSPSSSPFSQFGSPSGTYESVSQTQSSPSGSVSAPSKFVSFVGRPSQYAPAFLYSSASLPSHQSGSSVHSQAAVSAHSLSQSPAPHRWQPTTSGRFYSKFPTSIAALTQTNFSPQSVQSSRHLTGSMTQSSGSNVQAASEGVSSASSQAETLSDDIGKVWWSY